MPRQNYYILNTSLHFYAELEETQGHFKLETKLNVKYLTLTVWIVYMTGSERRISGPLWTLWNFSFLLCLRSSFFLRFLRILTIWDAGRYVVSQGGSCHFLYLSLLGVLLMEPGYNLSFLSFKLLLILWRHYIGHQVEQYTMLGPLLHLYMQWIGLQIEATHGTKLFFFFFLPR